MGIIDKEEIFNKKVDLKVQKILSNDDNVISVLGLVANGNLLGFISLFKNDECERLDLTPWYATMYVKKEYRGLGYSKILNEAIISKAIKQGYKKIYLKTDLINYYEKFGFKYMDKLNNGESIYYKEL